MRSKRKHTNGIIVSSKSQSRDVKKNKCVVCGKGFRTQSRFDSICNPCWADNEVHPFASVAGPRGAGYVN